MSSLRALDFKASPTVGAPRLFTKAGGREGKKAAEYILNEQSLQHGPIVAAGQWAVRGCCTKKPGDKTCRDAPRPGQIELALYPRVKTGSKSKKVVVTPGPALRFCVGFNKGYVLPVSDPREAQKIAREFQACVAGDAAKNEACAKKYAGSFAPLAEFGKPISSRAVRKGQKRRMSAGGRHLDSAPTGAGEYLEDATRFLKEGSCGLAIHHYADAREAYGKEPDPKILRKLDRFEKRVLKVCVVKRRGKRRRR
jgi:hypothetical protein